MLSWLRLSRFETRLCFAPHPLFLLAPSPYPELYTPSLPAHQQTNHTCPVGIVTCICLTNVNSSPGPLPSTLPERPLALLKQSCTSRGVPHQGFVSRMSQSLMPSAASQQKLKKRLQVRRLIQAISSKMGPPSAPWCGKCERP